MAQFDFFGAFDFKIEDDDTCKYTSAVLADERNFYKPSQAMKKMNAIIGGSEYVYAVYA